MAITGEGKNRGGTQSGVSGKTAIAKEKARIAAENKRRSLATGTPLTFKDRLNFLASNAPNYQKFVNVITNMDSWAGRNWVKENYSKLPPMYRAFYDKYLMENKK